MRIRILAPRATLMLFFGGIVPLSAQLVSGSTLQQQPTSPREQASIRAFEERVAAYVSLHRQLEDPLQPARPGSVWDVTVASRALAARIRLARQDARQGDILDSDVATVFRRRIAACLPAEEWEAVLAEQTTDEDGDPILIPALRVNMDWPATVPFNFVPPRLLRTLPPLPPELQYRIIGRSLVLWDHHADLIVDILPAAFVT